MCPVVNNVKMEPSEMYYLYSTAHNYLVAYFNYVYYLGLNPFRFKLSKSSGYILHTNYIQKVICGSLQISTTIYGFVKFIHLLSEGTINVSTNPSQLLGAWTFLVFIAYAPTWGVTTWRSKHSFMKIFELCQSRTSLLKATHRNYDVPIKWSWMASAIFHLFIIVYMASFVISEIGSYLMGECHLDMVAMNLKHELKELNSTNTSTTSYNFRLPSNLWSEAGIHEIVFAFYTFLLNAYFAISFVTAALVFLHLSIEFERHLHNESVNIEMVIERYNATEEIIEHLNQGISPTTLLQYITCITYYSHLLTNIFGCHNWMIMIVSIFWFVVMVLATIFAAEANLKMGRIKNLILSHVSARGNNVTLTFLRILQIQTQYMHACDEPIVLKGGKIFGITYGSVGTGLGLLVTYTIIILQLGSAQNQT